MNDRIHVIWEEYHTILECYIRSKLDSQQDVEDILQDIFVKVQSNLCTLKDEEKLKSWIYSITNNAIIDYYRKRKRTCEFLDVEEHIQNPYCDEKYANGEISICLKNMINKLPDIYKQVITLVCMENMTQIEISKKLGLSYSCTKSRVQRAKKLLKDMLSDCCSLEFDHRGNIIDYQYNINASKYCKRITSRNASFLN